MAVEERYFGDLAEDERERKRLQLLEEFLDPLAQRALTEAGVSAGSRVLEIGPGAGSMLRWLADKVGADGHVAAIDINPRFVMDIDLPNVTVQKADLLDPPDNLGQFDIVYARYVILHLPDTIAAARALFDLVKPGGRVVIIDLDWRTVRASDPSHPLAGGFDALMDTASEVLIENGIMDVHFGTKGAVALEAAGFSDVTSGGTTRWLRGASHDAIWYRECLIPVEAAINAYAPERAVSTDPVRDAYDDPTFSFSSPVETVTVGTRPSR